MPDTAEKMVSFSVSAKTMKKLGAVVCAICLLSFGVMLKYVWEARLSEVERNELTVLRGINEELKITEEKNQLYIEEMAKDLSLLQKDLDELKSVDSEIRLMLSDGDKKVSAIRPPSSAAGQESMGGPEVHVKPQDIENFLKDLRIQADSQHQSMSQLKEALLNKKAVERATPSIWPSEGALTSVFGWRDYPSGWHPGIDVANDIGTPVVATASGVVTRSEYMGGYGNMVVVDHGYGIETLYAHNEQNSVGVGQRVQKGDIIAQMGNTGFSTGPHVHYEVRVNGTAVNPSSFL